MVAYSLWAQPRRDSPLFRRLQEVINLQAGLEGTLSFEPHITVCSGMDSDSDEAVIATSLALCQKLRPYTTYFDEFGFHNTYFQSVFLHVQSSVEAIQTNAECRQAFGLDPLEPPYMPHLSIVYGDLSEERRHEVVGRLQATPRAEITGDASCWGFEVTELHLVRTPAGDKSMQSWKRLGSFPFGGHAASQR